MQPELLEVKDTAPRVVYLDNNATTRPLPEVVEAMVQVLGPQFGNASSGHSGGEEARRILGRARSSVAKLIGALPENILFTSSGTESNNMALHSGVAGDKAGGLLTTEIEHSSIAKTASVLEKRGVLVRRAAPNGSGEIEAETIEEAIGQLSPQLVSVQWVNSETGVINDVDAIRRICRDAGVLFHVDAAQAVGKTPVDISQLQADFVTFTAHKFHGPSGVGVIYVRNINELQPLVHGGDQEGGLRAGTENLAGIVGTGTAAYIRRGRLGEVQEKLSTIRDHFESSLMSDFPWIEINGASAERICNTSNLHFSGLDGQALVAQFDAIGIHCSQSSACTNLRPEPSYVLRAMGLSEKEAYASVRFSFSEQNSIEEINDALVQMKPIIRRLREILF